MTEYKTYKPAGVQDPYGTYVHALEPPLGSRMIFISGQTPVARDGTVPAKMEAQARIAWQNIKDVLADAGLEMHHLVRTTMYLTDRNLYSDADRVSAEFLGAHRTSAVCICVASLIEPDWLIEIEGIAAAPAGI